MVAKKKSTKKNKVVEKTALDFGVEVIQKVFKKKKFDDPFVAIDENSFKQSLPHIPTGSINIDYLIGGKKNSFGVSPCPGFPKGKIINLYGNESAGKTTLCLTVAAQTNVNMGSVAYIDWEYAVVNDYAKALGVAIDNPSLFKLSQPTTLEEGLMIIHTLAKAGVDLIVIDSVGAAVTKALTEQSIDEKGKKGQIGAIASVWSNYLPQLRGIIAKTGTCVIGVSQLRSTMSMTTYGGSGDTTQGGKGWKFYSDVRLGLAKLKSEKTEGYDELKHKKDKLSSGSKVRVRADKCKVSASQGRDVEIYIKFGEGIDDLRSVIEYGSNHRILRKEGGGWYSWERGNGESLRVQGLEKFKELLWSTEGAVDELYTVVLDKMYSSEDVLVADDAELEEDTAMQEIDNLLSGKNLDGTSIIGDLEVPDVEGD